MPFITIQLREGRTVEQKRELVKRVTDVVAEVAQVPKERVFIFLEDLTRENFGRGGELWLDQENNNNNK